jgi:hypothetical protein
MNPINASAPANHKSNPEHDFVPRLHSRKNPICAIIQTVEVQEAYIMSTIKNQLWIVVLIFLALGVLSGCQLPLPGADAPTPFVTITSAIDLSTEDPGSSPSGIIGGHLWHDLCAAGIDAQEPPSAPPAGCISRGELDYVANGVYEPGEPGLSGVEVMLGDGPCPATGRSLIQTGPDGSYQFSMLESGTYCVMIDAESERSVGVLIPGEWTNPQGMEFNLAWQEVELREGEARLNIDFGWDYEFLPVPPTPTEQVITDTPTPEATPSVEGTATLTAGDPRAGLGDPVFNDTFANGNNWAIYGDDHVSFVVVDNRLEMTAFNADRWEGWMLSWPVVADFYMEMTATFGDCDGDDRYGMMFRSTEQGGNWGGYLFGITCEGRYALRSWDTSSYRNIVSWQENEAINTGDGATNRLGVWVEGSMITLYVNGTRLSQASDSEHDNGQFGVFIGSADTLDFEVFVDQISYWLIN